MPEADNRANVGRIPLDLRIGVTGHRWLPGEDADVRATLRTTLADLVAAANRPTAATSVGCTVVSSLAEGTDRIVAEIGLELGARLEVVLPMPVSEYVEDFETPSSRDEFRRLLDQAATVDVVAAADSRPLRYRAAGRTVVDRVDVLLAVWDGAPASGPGGTAEIVEYARGLRLPVVELKAHRDAHPPITPPQPVGTPVGPLTPAAFRRLDRHNAARLTGRSAAAVQDALVAGEHADWLPYYLRADQLALRYQRLHLTVNRMLYALAVLAVVIVSGQLVFFPHHPGLAWIEFTDLGLLVAILLFARRYDLLGRWTSARFVAERLRSAMFLADVGATPSFALQPGGTADVWARADWAARAMREVWFRAPRRLRSSTPEDAVQRIETGWIAPQLAYHQRVLAKAQRRQKIAATAAIVLFVISMIAALLHSLDLFKPEDAPDYWAYVSIVVPTAGAAISGYAAQREYARQVLRSRQVIRDLQAVRRALEAAPSTQAVQVVAAQIDALVHSDAAEWFVTATLHEPELP